MIPPTVSVVEVGRGDSGYPEHQVLANFGIGDNGKTFLVVAPDLTVKERSKVKLFDPENLSAWIAVQIKQFLRSDT